MYGLPEDTDLTPLHGQELIQLNTTAFRFELLFQDVEFTAARISFQCAWMLQTDHGQPHEFISEAAEHSDAAAWLTRLIGQSIIATTILPPGTLRLGFSNGWQIDIVDDSPDYESFEIDFEGKLIVV